MGEGEFLDEIEVDLGMRIGKGENGEWESGWIAVKSESESESGESLLTGGSGGLDGLDGLGVWVIRERSNGDEGEQFGEWGTTNDDCVRHAVAVTVL